MNTKSSLHSSMSKISLPILASSLGIKKGAEKQTLRSSFIWLSVTLMIVLIIAWEMK